MSVCLNASETDERLRLTDEGIAELRALADDERLEMEQRVMVVLAVDELQIRRQAAVGGCR